jgi:hypothetical protein
MFALIGLASCAWTAKPQRNVADAIAVKVQFILVSLDRQYRITCPLDLTGNPRLGEIRMVQAPACSARRGVGPSQVALTRTACAHPMLARRGKSEQEIEQHAM